ncbi:MAG TPA: cysteine desulfurase family protein [Gemmatimonadaceae bacterium]|nr:cysteine desulfurase family protein [Gemmatimonadaceae bacterium]
MSAYLDYNATTPLDPRVCRATKPWATERFGNASSRDHRFGWDAAEAVSEARSSVADALGAGPVNTLLVSSATEALNTVVRSYVGYDRWAQKTIVTCATEHEAVLAPCRGLCALTGVGLHIVAVDDAGHVDLEQLARLLRASPGALVAFMAANNETGTVHPVREIASLVHAADGLFLCDTTQAFGRCAIDVSSDGIDFATVSAHKIHGPQGVGALVAGRSLTDELQPLILGGGQEQGLRGGTPNVAGIVGLGEACRIARDELDQSTSRIGVLRDRLEDGIVAQTKDVWINGDRRRRLCNTSNIGFRGVDARTLIRDMHDVAVSTRSACSSGSAGPSHVLKAIGLSDEDAYSCVRFSLGRFTTQDEIDYTIGKVVASAHKLVRAKSVRR